MIIGGWISLGMHEPNIARFVGAGVFMVGLLIMALPTYFADRRYAGTGLYSFSTSMLPLFIPVYAVLSGLGVTVWMRIVAGVGILVLTILASVATYRYENRKR